MSNSIPGNQKHLTLHDRQFIEDPLDQGLSFREMAKFLCKDPTTISKEIRLHRMNDTVYACIGKIWSGYAPGLAAQVYWAWHCKPYTFALKIEQ